jgi:arabinofuranosyltransferase
MGGALLLTAHAGAAARVAALGVFLVSSTFVDYATSGLETPLTYLLLSAFLVVYLMPPGTESRMRPASNSRLFWLMALAALLVLNRLDTAVMLAPALVETLIRIWRARAWRALLGWLPLVAWEAFSVVYYGVPFPNTAYAKLATGVAQADLTAQGLAYLGNSWRADRLVLAAIAAALLMACWRRRLPTALLAAGLVLHIVYVVRIGGDFMSGRFLAPGLVAAIGLLLHHPLTRPQRWTAAALLVVLFALGAPHAFARDRFRPPYPSVDSLIDGAGIADERRIYVRETSLRDAIRRRAIPVPARQGTGLHLRAMGPAVMTRDAVGFFGLGAGPGVHIVDVLGLGDPLLARLPARTPWRIGHFQRDIPAGYMERLRGKRDTLVDPALNAYYEDIRLLTRAPLWSRERWAAIVRLNLRQRVWKSPS